MLGGSDSAQDPPLSVYCLLDYHISWPVLSSPKRWSLSEFIRGYRLS